MRSESERRCRSGLRHPVPSDYAADQENDAKNAGTGDRNFSSMALEHPQAHDDRDGDGHADGEDSPRAIRKRVNDDNAETGERDQENEKYGDHRHQSGKRADFGAGNIRQGAAAVTYRSHQHGEVLYASREHRANQQPKEARRKSELRRQSWPHQRTCSGDGGEVMSEEHPAWRSDVIMAIGVSVAGGCAAVVERQGLCGNERAVVPIRKRVHAQRTHQYGESIHNSLQTRSDWTVVPAQSKASYTHRGIWHKQLFWSETSATMSAIFR